MQAEKALESWKKSVRNRDQQVTRKPEDTEIARTVERADRLQRSEQQASKEKELAKAFRQAEAKAKASDNRKTEAELALLDTIASERATANVLDSMTTRITRAWRRPVAYNGGLEVYLRIALASNGELIDTQIIRPSGNTTFDRSAITAVRRAAPFNEVANFDAKIFEEKFRSLTIKFRPED
ncbi:MAG: cell envelope integrity protein TolA [Alphaproteobacteria bacterium]|nr:cell envelope integrity protein TolA [Alphaproteobacteria bacterium]